MTAINLPISVLPLPSLHFLVLVVKLHHNVTLPIEFLALLTRHSQLAAYSWKTRPKGQIHLVTYWGVIRNLALWIQTFTYLPTFFPPQVALQCHITNEIFCFAHPPLLVSGLQLESKTKRSNPNHNLLGRHQKSGTVAPNIYLFVYILLSSCCITMSFCLFAFFTRHC